MLYPAELQALLQPRGLRLAQDFNLCLGRMLKRGDGVSRDDPLARRTRTVKLCAFDARREGQSGCSPEGEMGKIGSPSLGSWHVSARQGWAGEKSEPFDHPVWSWPESVMPAASAATAMPDSSETGRKNATGSSKFQVRNSKHFSLQPSSSVSRCKNP